MLTRSLPPHRPGTDLAKRRYKISNLAYMNLEGRPMSDFLEKKSKKNGKVKKNMHDYPEAQLEYQFRLQVGSLACRRPL